MSGAVAALWAQLAALWSWWLAEIGDMVPALARLTRPRLPRRLRAERLPGGGLALIDSETGLAPQEAAAPLPAELPEDLVLVRTIDLPRAARANLAEIAAARLSWETPFAPDAVYHGFHAAAAPGAETLSLTLAATPKPVADAFLREVSAAGAAPAGAGVAAGPDGAWIELLSDPKAKSDNAGARMVVLAAALVAVIVAGPLLSYRAQAAWIGAQTEALEADAKAAGEARAELRRLSAGSAALSDAGRRFASRTALLDRLSALVPAPGWLYRLQLTDDTLELFGYADDPGTVIAALEAAPEFDAVDFRSPTVRDETTGKQRFHIGATLAGGAQ